MIAKGTERRVAHHPSRVSRSGTRRSGIASTSASLSVSGSTSSMCSRARSTARAPIGSMMSFAPGQPDIRTMFAATSRAPSCDRSDATRRGRAGARRHRHRMAAAERDGRGGPVRRPRPRSNRRGRPVTTRRTRTQRDRRARDMRLARPGARRPLRPLERWRRRRFHRRPDRRAGPDERLQQDMTRERQQRASADDRHLEVRDVIPALGDRTQQMSCVRPSPAAIASLVHRSDAPLEALQQAVQLANARVGSAVAHRRATAAERSRQLASLSRPRALSSTTARRIRAAMSTRLSHRADSCAARRRWMVPQ